MTKEEIRKELYERCGRKCHYCEIDEDKFLKIWGSF